MDIIADTREHSKEWDRIKKQFDNIPNIRYFRSKLLVGDYQSLDNPRLVVDRKKDLLEVAGNICQQHKRFTNEVKLAIEAGIQLIILVEHGQGIESIADVYFWQNPRSFITEIKMVDGKPRRVKKYPKAIQGSTLAKAMKTYSERYGILWEFCKKEDTGRMIVELLGG